MEMIIHRLVDRISELMSRYEKTLPEMKDELKALELKVDEHLRKMGFVW
jgi:type I restriction enzyme M protein